jgi:hypothetical protein
MFPTDPFSPAQEAQFRAARRAALAEIHVTTFWLVAILVMLFSWWDWFIDPIHWRTAFWIRSLGACVILASGLVQRLSARASWAPAIGKVRFAASVLAVAGALAVLDQGFLIGLAGLISVLLAGPYIAIDRRDILWLNGPPLILMALILYLAGVERFVLINTAIFVALAVAVSLLLARVFEASNRRAFLLEQQLMREARTDALTGLSNRRALGYPTAARWRKSAKPS